MGNVRKVPSCYPCGYAAQFGETECVGCTHNDGAGRVIAVGPFETDGGRTLTAPSGATARVYPSERRQGTPPRIPRRPSSPHVERNRIREQRTRAFLIVVFVWMALIVAAQTRACVATSPQDAAAQQIEAMHAAGAR